MKYILVYILVFYLVVGAWFFYRCETRITALEFRVQTLTRDAGQSKVRESVLYSSQKHLGARQKEQAELLSAVAKAVLQLLDQGSAGTSFDKTSTAQ